MALTSAGAITDGGTGTAVVLEAADPVLVASTGIGTAAAPIQAQINKLAANAGSGGLWLANTGSLTIGVLRSVTGLSAGGAIDVSTSGTMAVDQDVSAPGNITLYASVPPSGSTRDILTVPAGVQVQSTGGSVTLHGTGNITLAVGATLVGGHDGGPHRRQPRRAARSTWMARSMPRPPRSTPGPAATSSSTSTSSRAASP